MIEGVLLDTGPLGRITSPNATPVNLEIAAWLQQLLDGGIKIFLPEIADYELRRNFILEDKTKSLTRLDQLKAALNYLPLTTDTMQMAAEFWASARKRHQPTADRQALDCDAILAAQAKLANAIVATGNVGHLGRFVTAKNWREITIGAIE